MQGTAKPCRCAAKEKGESNLSRSLFILPLLEKGKERRNVAGWEKEEERRDVSDMDIL